MQVRLRVKDLAEERGLNMSQLQRQTGLTMGMVRRYWYNEGKDGQLDGVSLSALNKIAEVLEVRPGELIESATEARSIQGNKMSPVLAAAW
jgi:DNA-binding Xre family transcriptional regulator